MFADQSELFFRHGAIIKNVDRIDKWRVQIASVIGTSTYSRFLEQKAQSVNNYGFVPKSLPAVLFDFQQSLVSWALQKGRGAIFADCGLGKTLMQLVWADEVSRHESRPVLILTPLAVSPQTVREGQKFGIDVVHSRDGEVVKGINVTNYERLHYFKPQDFCGVVCDESSILKSFEGSRRLEITEFMKKVPYRLLCTATAAPNDYIELGTSSEALGELGYTDMLTKFFKNDQHTVKPMRYTGFGNPRGMPPGGEHTDKWRLKGHAEIPFWRWVCSWARAIRRPSDLGFNDGDFILPPLIESQHVIEAQKLAPGMLFHVPAVGLQEQREERRRTIQERCEKVAALVANTGKPALVWCHLNEESERLADLIEDSREVCGDDDDEAKEEAFGGFCGRQIRVLVTKPKIGAWGMNFQHCSHVTFFPSHSFEQYYQGVRRCWRFGQTDPVHVDIVTTEGEKAVLENVQRKAKQADAMFSRLVTHMNDSLQISTSTTFGEKELIPSWL